MNVSGNMHSVSLSLEADAQSDRVIMPEVADETLIAGIGEGDRDALSVLFRRYAGLLRGIALRILRDKSDARFVSVHSPQGQAVRWFQVRGHHPRDDEFLELCAISTSSQLTGEEQKLLQKHLASCPQKSCRTSCLYEHLTRKRLSPSRSRCRSARVKELSLLLVLCGADFVAAQTGSPMLPR